MTSTDLLPSLRDLIVHLHRGNATQAETIVTRISGYLDGASPSAAAPELEKHVQQTKFAIDEVRILLTAGDFKGAAVAARDAVKEWQQGDKV